MIRLSSVSIIVKTNLHVAPSAQGAALGGFPHEYNHTVKKMEIRGSGRYYLAVQMKPQVQPGDPMCSFALYPGSISTQALPGTMQRVRAWSFPIQKAMEVLNAGGYRSAWCRIIVCLCRLQLV